MTDYDVSLNFEQSLKSADELRDLAEGYPDNNIKSAIAAICNQAAICGQYEVEFAGRIPENIVQELTAAPYNYIMRNKVTSEGVNCPDVWYISWKESEQGDGDGG